MKPFSPRQIPPPVSRAGARTSFFFNQLATPGLGSLMAGRRIAGTGQLLLALAGFALVTGWFVMNLISLYEQIEGNPQPKSYAWLGEWGALIFAAAWLWSLGTSLALLRQASALDAAALKNIPPRIGEVPGGTKI